MLQSNPDISEYKAIKKVQNVIFYVQTIVLE